MSKHIPKAEDDLDLDLVATNAEYRLRHLSSDRDQQVYAPHRTILQLVERLREAEHVNLMLRMQLNADNVIAWTWHGQQITKLNRALQAVISTYEEYYGSDCLTSYLEPDIENARSAIGDVPHEGE